MPVPETLTAYLKRTFLKGKAITLHIRRGNGKLSVDLIVWAVIVVFWVFVWHGE